MQVMESRYRDRPIDELLINFDSDLHFPLYVHLLQAFAYREAWAAPLLSFVQFDSQGRPHFLKNPRTPEAHRHKFLCALTLSEGSPGYWQVGGRNVVSEDFIEPLLQGPLENWGDDSLYPEPSWTLQYLSAHLDERGCWRGQKTPLGEVTQRCLLKYFRDYERGDLYVQGKTLYTESGLHLLEAINKLCRAQSKMIVEAATQSPLAKFFPMFKRHLLERLTRSMQEITGVLNSSLMAESADSQLRIRLAISNLLVAGHLLETCVHPRGALVASWQGAEREQLANHMRVLASLMEFFFEAKTLDSMKAEQRRAYHFPLFHAYGALRHFQALAYS